MTTDERLDRLVERHEALSQSVERLAIETRELRAALSSLIASVGDLTASMSGLHAAVAADGENIRARARIAEIHERRMTRLEGGGGDEA
jgi:hypothetical protein